MLKHIVFMKFKPEVSKSDIDELKKGLGGLPALVPEIKSFEFGQDVLRTERSWDFALISAFADPDAMRRYDPSELGARQFRSNGNRQACGVTSWWTALGPHEPGEYNRTGGGSSSSGADTCHSRSMPSAVVNRV